MGLNEEREISGEHMLQLTCQILEFPTEDRCEIQEKLREEGLTPIHDHNILLKMDLQ